MVKCIICMSENRYKKIVCDTIIYSHPLNNINSYILSIVLNINIFLFTVQKYLKPYSVLEYYSLSIFKILNLKL